MPILHDVFQKIVEGRTFPSSFCEAKQSYLKKIIQQYISNTDVKNNINKQIPVTYKKN